MLALLTNKQGTYNLVSNICPDSGECLIIDKHDPYLVTFPSDTDSMFFKINILDIHITEFRYPHTCGIDGSYNQFVPGILDRINKTENLTMFKISNFLLLDARTFDTTQGVCYYSPLSGQETVK